MKVILEWYELLFAASVGIRRNIEALEKKLPDLYGFDQNEWQTHIEGACGEMAFAKGTGRYWSGSINTFRNGGDVGSIQIRTRSKPNYDLIVRPNDRDEDIFVLVIGNAPAFSIIGWIRAKNAKRDEWLQTHGNRPPAYFVPQSRLHDIVILR